MKNRIINYSIFGVGILSIAFAIIFVKNVIILNDSKWNITSNVSAEEMTLNKSDEVDRVIDIYKEDSSIERSIHDSQMTEELQKKFATETIESDGHGIKNEDPDSLIYETGTGIQIMLVTKETNYGIKWACEADFGNARFVIKDINKNIVYKIDENTKSTQEEIKLPAGTYFIYDEVIDGVNIDYYYYFAKR